MNFDIKDEYDGKIYFRTDKPLVFIHFEPDYERARPWALYALAIDDYENYREKAYYVTRSKSYTRARRLLGEEIGNYDGYSEFQTWPVR